VVLLLKKGSDLNSRNNLGMTPFLVACASGDLKKIQLLLEAGADKTAKDSRGWGAIDFARNRLDPAKPEVLKYLEPIVPASTATAPPQTKDASPTAAKSS
jgi:ankyrin repeat protein